MKRLNYYTFEGKGDSFKTAGIVIREGEDWILTKANYSDFQLDGYELINKHHLEKTVREEDEKFIEDVLKACDKWITLHNIEYEDIPLSHDLLFEYLFRKDIFVSISSNKKGYFDIGTISNMIDQKLTIRRMDSWGEWMDKSKTYDTKNIHLLSLDTDYMRSLLNYYVSKL